VSAPARYPLRTRILHWLTAVLIFSTLLIGFVMVNSIGSYASLRTIHMTLGVLILAVVVLRAANRFTHRAPRLPDTVGWIEHKLVIGSELMLYALMLAQPLVGWAMVSATGKPVVILAQCSFRASHPLMPTCFSRCAKRIRCWPIRWSSSSPLTSARCCCTR